MRRMMCGIFPDHPQRCAETCKKPPFGGFFSHALFDLQCNQLQGLVHRYRRQASSHIDRVQQELLGLGLALLDDIHQALGQCRVVFVEVMATR